MWINRNFENKFENKFYEYTSWDFLSSVRCAKLKLNVAEIPGDEPARVGGIEKVNKIRVGFMLLVQIMLEFIYPIRPHK